MKVLDLFSGLEGWSGPWKERGHEVYRVELDAQFPAEYRDIRTFDPSIDMPWMPDVILASPPCTGFSVMRIGRNWTMDNQPKTDTARMGLLLVKRTLQVIEQCKPKFFIIENPRAKLRALPILQHLFMRTVTYCQYGEERMKPTDLWGGFPPSLALKEACKNGDTCHVSAPRGSRTGTQGMDKHISAKIPKALSLAVLEACEKDLA